MFDFVEFWMPVAVPVAVLGFGLFLVVRGQRTYFGGRKLRRRGVAKRAVVTAKYRERVRVSSDDTRARTPRYRHLLDYQFEAYGSTYEKTKQRPSKALWYDVSEGAQVDIVYVPHDPEISALAEHGARAQLIGGGLQLTIGIALVLHAVGFAIYDANVAAKEPEARHAEADWVRDVAIVEAVHSSADIFVRIMRPGTKVVRLAVGDDDGGRDYVGIINMELPADVASGLNVGEIVPVLRDPSIKEFAVLLAAN